MVPVNIGFVLSSSQSRLFSPPVAAGRWDADWPLAFIERQSERHQFMNNVDCRPFYVFSEYCNGSF